MQIARGDQLDDYNDDLNKRVTHSTIATNMMNILRHSVRESTSVFEEKNITYTRLVVT